MKRLWAGLREFIGFREFQYIVGLGLIGAALWPMGWQWSAAVVGAVVLYVGLWWRVP